jgi:hypothetical protein
MKKILLLLVIYIPIINSLFINNYNKNIINIKKFNTLNNISLVKLKNNNILTKQKQINKYKPLYKILFKISLIKSIRFKSIILILILIRNIYTIYNNISELIYFINIFDNQDFKEIKNFIDLLSFINLINIFYIFTILEIYDNVDHTKINIINKKILLYVKYIKLYNKDCLFIKYI